MKKIIVLLALTCPFFCQAQEKGIKFEQGLSWVQIKAKAKAENKYIFVDCYATWCGPCKNMDKNVYPVDSIGIFVNSHYLSVKVQFDKTPADNEMTRKWYADARYLEKQYKINSYPTLLFFAPDGKLVHRSIGYVYPVAFMSLVKNTLDSAYQYYPLLEAFQKGRLDYKSMPYLARTARSLDDKTVANAVAKDYIENYLLQLKENKLYTSKNIDFASSFVHGSKDKAFQFFYSHGDRIDSALKDKGFSQRLVDQIIEHEEITVPLYKDTIALKENRVNPDWTKITQTIRDKYNSNYADRIVLWGKIQWLEYKKDWQEYSKNVMLKIEKYGPYCKYYPYEAMWHVELWNFSAWEIFKRSNDTVDLKKALEWSKKVIDEEPKSSKFYPLYLDTYANLLYKLGETTEATSIEEKALTLASPGFAIKTVAENLAKIKKGEATWPTN